MATGDQVVLTEEVKMGNINIVRNDLPKTTFSKSGDGRQYKPQLSFFKNSAAMRFELSRNNNSVMLIMRPATSEKNEKGRPIYDNKKREIMSLGQSDLQQIIYFLRYAPEIENIQPIKLYHEKNGVSKILNLQYKADKGTFTFSLSRKGIDNVWIGLSGQETLGIELLLSHLYIKVLGF